jgi:hypothetical protein
MNRVLVQSGVLEHDFHAESFFFRQRSLVHGVVESLTFCRCLSRKA